MRLAGITLMRNECDIVEAFVRHNGAVLDRLYVIDNKSSDGTFEILERLVASRQPIKLGFDHQLPYYQANKTTRLIKAALEDEAWDWFFPLDGDELLVVPDRAALEAEIAALGAEHVGLLVCDQYAPTELDDEAELDVVSRITPRIESDPVLPRYHGKAIVSRALASKRAVTMGEGNHHVLVADRRVPERWLSSARIAHYPVRSVEQFISKVVTTRLAWLSRGDYRPSLGQHIGNFYGQLRNHPNMVSRHLTDAAFAYFDSYLGPQDCNYHRQLIRDPVRRQGDPLRYLDLATVRALPRILEFVEQIARQLGQANSGQASGELEP
jgi:hypothetical protein